MPQSWQCRQGACLLIPSGPNSCQHLFTILVNPCILPNRGNKPQVLSVGISSVRANIPYDNACIIRQGEHPFVRHDSYVRYRDARIDAVEHIENRVHEGIFSVKPPCGEQLLKRIIAGASTSRYAAREVKLLIEKFAIA